MRYLVLLLAKPTQIQLASTGTRVQVYKVSIRRRGDARVMVILKFKVMSCSGKSVE